MTIAGVFIKSNVIVSCHLDGPEHRGPGGHGLAVRHGHVATRLRGDLDTLGHLDTWHVRAGHVVLHYTWHLLVLALLLRHLLAALLLHGVTHLAGHLGAGGVQRGVGGLVHGHALGGVLSAAHLAHVSPLLRATCYT